MCTWLVQFPASRSPRLNELSSTVLSLSCKYYADHSLEILAALVKSTGRDERGACKTLLYGGKTATWLSEHKVTADKVPAAFIEKGK